jgi:hypothetical protein
LQYNYTLNPIGIFNAIKYMYTYYPDPNNRSHIREEFVNFWSDYFFVAPQVANEFVIDRSTAQKPYDNFIIGFVTSNIC